MTHDEPGGSDMVGRGFAVIDVETTGFSPAKGDRVLELGGVALGAGGRVDALIETLVDPMRDVGPTHVHGITARDLVGAPSFDAIAPAVLDFLDGRVIVGHNVSFDLRFLVAELERAGYRTPQPVIIDTMSLAKQLIRDDPPRFRLGDVCDHLGVDAAALSHDLGLETRPEHSALGDALRTAALLSAFINTAPGTNYWAEQLEQAARVRWPNRGTIGEMPARRRGDGDRTADHTVIAVLRAVDAAITQPASTTAYTVELEETLLDRQLDADEVDRLIGIATRLGIDVATLGSLHRGFFDRIVQDAWADGTLTPTELLDIQRVAELLEIDHDTVIASQFGIGGSALSGSVPVGSEIVLTGEMSRPRVELEAILFGCGYVAAASVTKRTRLLIAADPHTQSGKAQRARRYGIPVLGLRDGLALLGIDG